MDDEHKSLVFVAAAAASPSLALLKQSQSADSLRDRHGRQVALASVDDLSEPIWDGAEEVFDFDHGFIRDDLAERPDLGHHRGEPSMADYTPSSRMISFIFVAQRL
jgi:hypothetical protein